MTPEEMALYAPVVVAILAASRMFIQLSKVIAKVDMIAERMEKMEKLHVTVATLDERSESVDRRLKVLESDGHPNLSA